MEELNARLSSVTDSLSDIVALLENTSENMLTGRNGNKATFKRILTLKDKEAIFLNLKFTVFYLGVIQRQYQNEQIGILNSQFPGCFYWSIKPINISKEFVEFGIKNGVWELGEGVEL